MRFLYYCAFILTIAALVCSGCDRKKPTEQAPVPEVDVAHPVVRESVEWDEYTGRLGAIESVDVRARVSGYLEQIHFKAGQIVNKGDKLFTIDPRPFEADLERARAEVKSAQAELDHAKFDLERIEGLKKNESAPEKEYRDTLFAERNAHAAVDRSRADEKLAALNLEWSTVVAPITGRISREFVTVGNLIHDGTSEGTLLSTIVSLDPIYCYFDADEQAYLKYTRMAKSGERASSRVHANPVRVALFDEMEFRHEGHMDFVDNAIDQRTGTIRGRAILPNPDGLLIPGLFVRVRLIGSGVRPMVFVPDAAIATDQTSRIAYVVDGQNVVHPRAVVLGRLRNGLRRILSGLDGSEKIVVSGIQRARPNDRINPKTVDVCVRDWVPDPLTTSQPTSMPTSQMVEGAAP